MEIKKVYMTSKGMFWELEEASKLCNREKVYGSRPGDLVERESVRESYVLVHGDQVFALSMVNVK